MSERPRARHDMSVPPCAHRFTGPSFSRAGTGRTAARSLASREPIVRRDAGDDSAQLSVTCEMFTT